MSSAGNRLTGVTNPSYTAAYTYAADGLRLRVQESNAQYTDRWLQPLGPFGAGVAAQRVQPYDGVRPVLEGTLSGDTYTTVNKYVWEGASYYDSLAYALVGGSWRYYMYDGLGSTRQLMLHASPYTVTDTYQYEAFGNLMGSTGTTANLARSRPPVGGRDRHGGAARPHLATYRYVGSLGYYQTGNDLMHLGARYYMPEVGRFTGQDALPRQSGGDYLYSGSSPTTRVDPSGLAFGITRAYCMSRYNAIRNWAQTRAERCRCEITKAANEASASFDMSCKTACSHIGQDQIRSDCYRQCDLAAGHIKDFFMEGTKACDILESAGLAAADAYLLACLKVADLPDPHLPHIPWPPKFWPFR